jgi:hypothetical protein
LVNRQRFSVANFNNTRFQTNIVNGVRWYRRGHPPPVS